MALTKLRVFLVVCVLVQLLLAPVVCSGPLTAWADDGQAMYRLYNPYTGEHFYTAEAPERDNAMCAGWRYEGAGWTAPGSGEAVYRVYNPYVGDHHYTMDAAERDALVAAGWLDEGASWCSDPLRVVPLYREYNPNAFSCNHNYTTDIDEHDALVSAGWLDEGIAWFGVDDPAQIEPFANPSAITMPSDLSAVMPATLAGTLRYVEDHPVIPICGYYLLDFDEPIEVTCKPFRLGAWNTEELGTIQVGINYNSLTALSNPIAWVGRGDEMLDPHVGRHVVVSGNLKSDAAGTWYWSTDVVLSELSWIVEL